MTFLVVFSVCFCCFLGFFSWLDERSKKAAKLPKEDIYLDPYERMDPTCVAIKNLLMCDLSEINRELAHQALNIQKERVHQKRGGIY